MLNKAQTEYNQQQNSVAAFFRQASNGASNPVRSMPMPMPDGRLNSLEQIERQIRTSPPSHHDTQNNNLQPTQPTLANSPLAQFFNSNNLNNVVPSRPAATEMKSLKENPNVQRMSVPPGFMNNNGHKAPPKNLLMGASKETKLITPTMLATTNNNEKKPSAPEPLTKNQLLQALNYLIENDDEFMKKLHQVYIKNFEH